MLSSDRRIRLFVVTPDNVDLDATAEITYTRMSDRAGAGTPPIEETKQVVIYTSRGGTLEIPDAVPGSRLHVVLFPPDRSTLVERDLALVPDENEVTLKLTDVESESLRAGRPMPIALPIVRPRSARLVSLNFRKIDFTRAALRIAVLDVTRGDWSQLELDKLFKSAKPVTTSIAVPADAELTKLATMRWTPVHVAVDGRFTALLPSDVGGWLWWFSGSQVAVGAVIEDLSRPHAETIAIMLPPIAMGERDGKDSKAPKQPRVRTRARAVFDESELADNPEVYTEDPGTFCRPFQNPERILSERPFYTLLRVEQPMIGSESTLRLDDHAILDFERPSQPSAAASIMARIAPSTAVRASLAVASARNLFVRAAALPVSYMASLGALRRGRTVLDAAHPVQWESDAFQYQATSIARGHLLEYRVRWRSSGYSLGTVAKTLTLTPRQIRRIEKIDWARVERSRRAESTQFSERAGDEMVREQSYDDAVRSTLSEWSRGRSESESKSLAGGLGFSGFGLVIGGGGGGSNSSSSSSQDGGRTVSASEEQNLRDSIRRYGDSLRRLESVVVNEVVQQESVTGTTEIIRNPNYGHSLSVIYYQILRHLRVDTEFAGVRECLFIPFAIKPFTLFRMYRWREALQMGLLDRQYLLPLRYLRETLTGFTDTSIPAGRRADQPIQHIHGSVYLRIAIARPADAAEDAFNEAAWSVLNLFLNTSARSVHARLKQLGADLRDRAFQTEDAPGVVARWVNTLQFIAGPGTNLLKADFTLATAYRYNNVVRVDFSIPIGAGQTVTRQQLSSIRIKAVHSLPPGSVANVVRLSLNYQTDQFNQKLSVEQGENDLISTTTGLPDSGAALSAPPTQWERQDLRAEIVQGVRNLLQHLNEHLEYYHKVIWWNMDRDRLYMLLDGFYVPGTPLISVASIVEREPIAIVGNALVFRVSSGSFLGWGKLTSPTLLHNYYHDGQVPRDSLYVSLPTDGLYAQAIMDECLALEEHRGDVDWVLEDKEPELGDLDPSLFSSRRAEPPSGTPSPMPSTLINLQNAPTAPNPAGLGDVLKAVTEAGAFRDMAGLAGTQANAKAALDGAMNLASDFGSKAVDLAKAKQGTATANQKLASIEKARDSGLIDKSQASGHAAEALREMNMKPAEAPLTQDAGVAALVSSASQHPDRAVQVKRGADEVSVGSSAIPIPASAPVSIQFPFAPGTTIGSTKAQAIAAIDAFAARAAPLAFKVDRAAVAARLRVIVEDPIKVEQGEINVCGPAAVFRTVLAIDPLTCATLVIDLAEKGKGKFFSDSIEACADLRNQTYDAAWGCPVAEWIALSSMRDDENAVIDFEGTPADTAAGMTLPGEIVDWLKATNLYTKVSDDSNVVITKSISHAMGLKVDASTVNILLIHSHLLRQAAATNKKSDTFILNSFPNHWVVLDSAIERPTSDKVKLRVWSWGDVYMVELPVATMEANYYGAVIGTRS